MRTVTFEIDDEELEALIDFQRAMRDGALESGEEAEAKQRSERIRFLKQHRRKV